MEEWETNDELDSVADLLAELEVEVDFDFGD